MGVSDKAIPHSYLISHTMKTKREIRQQIREAKRVLTQEERLSAERNVLGELVTNMHVAKAKNIVAYWSMPDELPTQAIIERLRQEHDIYLPIIVGDEIEFRLYEGRDSLQPESKYGILEPVSKTTLPENAAAVVIVPGVAFNREGARLGRGGGYYDKILGRLKGAYKIGVAFGCQEVKEIPTEQYDIFMDEVIFG